MTCVSHVSAVRELLPRHILLLKLLLGKKKKGYEGNNVKVTFERACVCVCASVYGKYSPDTSNHRRRIARTSPCVHTPERRNPMRKIRTPSKARKNVLYNENSTVLVVHVYMPQGKNMIPTPCPQSKPPLPNTTIPEGGPYTRSIETGGRQSLGVVRARSARQP